MNHDPVDKPSAGVNDAPGADATAALAHTIIPEQHDLGGFIVRRALPHARQRLIGPWIFFDHFGPVTFPPGQGIDVRPHPHINLATVTFLFQGEMLHRDSLGNELTIQPGAINLMVAGRGIVHSERQRESIKANNNQLHGLQLWLALPEADEETAPQFLPYPASDFPSLPVDGVPVRVLIGAAYGRQSPVRTFADTLYIEAVLKAGQSLRLPDHVEQLGLYLIDGALHANDKQIARHTLAVLHTGQPLTVTATVDAHLVLIGGARLSHRHIWWNFVSSRRERIEQAKRDWRSGAFPKIPGDASEFIPLPADG